MTDFPINDQRHSARQVTSSGLYVGNGDAEMRRLKDSGFPMPNNPVMARLEARKVASDLQSRGTVSDVQNRAAMAAMRQDRFRRAGSGGAMTRTGANTQMVLPKVRQPLGSLMDKGVPFNVHDPDELTELRRWCNTPAAPVWMGDYSFKPMGEIKAGDQVIGWETQDQGGREWRTLTKSTVLAINRRMAPEVVRVTLESGRTIECTPDHHWLRYTRKDHDKWVDSEYGPAEIGSMLRHVVNPTAPLDSVEKVKAAHWLAGIIDADGCASGTSLTLHQSAKANPAVVDRIDSVIALLGLVVTRSVENNPRINNFGYPTENMVHWTFKGRQQTVDLLNWTRPEKLDVEFMDRRMLTSKFGTPDRVITIESLGPGEVISMQTTTGNYTAWGMASRNCRLFYATHPLVPLLVDIYSKFPVMGLEFVCLAAETPVITAEGVREIKDLAGGVHRILTTGGKWVEAPFKSFGEQALMRLVVQRNGRQREFFATPEHRWFVQNGAYRSEVTTSNLTPGMRLASSYGRNRIHSTNPSPFGIAHGVTFGDGSRNTSGGGCHVDLFGDKDANLLKYFAGCTTYEYGPRTEGAVPSVRVTDLPRYFKDRPILTESASYLYGWLAGYFAADGTVSKKGEAFIDSASQGDIEHARAVCQLLGIHTSDPYVIDIKSTRLPNGTEHRSRTTYRLRLANESLTEKFFCVPEHRSRFLAHADRKSLETWKVVSVKETGRFEEVYCAVVPGTEAFTLDGNVLTGNCKDPEIEKFYTQMFMDDLNYEEFLPDGLLREYFMVGEVTALAHFNEDLGIWSSEEILNPDMVRVSKSLFVEQERVQLLVKDLVESLRTGPGGMALAGESPSEKYERTWEYQQLTKNYPEIISAAAQNDGLDISDALVSRMVNKAAWWDLRGTPHLLRSFRTLMLEESLNAAQDAVCDRLYAPMILATLGIENMGDGEPWIPDQAELEDLRDDIQSALAADFKLLCHNFGLNVTSVFGRESVPRFDTDYDRVDAQIMQSWGIGQGLIMGGSGDTYAGTAINREVCEQLMKSAQNKVVRHLRKRMEIVSEAQEFYDYDLKGGKRVPIYETVVEEDDETGEQYTVRVPKLLIPEVKFATLNLRDEATERNFVSQLKQLGVPISDKTLAINIPFEFEQELERQAQETIDKGLAQAEAMHVLQQMCDEQDYAYPPELTQHLMATLQLRQGLAQTEQLEDQTKMMDQQIAQASPAGMMGLLPGTTMQPLAGDAQQQSANQQPQAAPPAAGQQQVTATMHGPRAAGPSAFPPGGEVSLPGGSVEVIVPKNRQRPEESDEWRGSGELPGREPKEGSRRLPPVHLPGRGGASPRDIAKLANKLRGFKSGPSSYRRSYVADQSRVEQAIHRRAAAPVSVEKLVHDPAFYELLHAQGHEAEIVADWPEIVGGGAPESRKLLERLLEDYESITGSRPSRNF